MFGFLKKKSRSDSPAVGAMPERYAGRPLLIVLENYVLDCIGKLPPDKQVLVSSIVNRVWGGGDDWKAVVRAQLHLEPSIDQSLRDIWSHNQQLARQHNQTLDEVQFARTVVDQNLAHLIGDARTSGDEH